MSTVVDIKELTFDPPGPGSWQIAAAQMPRPLPRFQTEIHPEGLAEGFRATSRRYGLLLDTLDYRFLHGFGYVCRRMAPEAEIPERCSTAEQAFEGRLWRQDMDRWESEVKPAAISASRELQAVDPAALSDQELLDHIDRCREHYKQMIFQQHYHNGAALVPLGDFLAHAMNWTGLPLGKLAAVLRGSAPVSAGASAERDRVLAALDADADARSLLESSEEPGDILEALRSQPGEAGAAAGAWLDMVGYRLLDGVEVSNPYALEKPEVLVKGLRAELGDGRPAATDDQAGPGIDEVREQVPEGDRAQFDSLLDEARYTYRLRDERGIFTAVWAGGLLRRAILEAGDRLAREGRIEHPEHIVEAGYDELRGLIADRQGPSAEELAERAAFRTRYAATDAPPLLGPPPKPPKPPSGLPPAAMRGMRAMNVVLSALFGEADAQSEARVVRGLGASPGVFTGTARLVEGPEEFERVQQGDIVVTHSTSEAFNVILPLLGGLVTDAGGLLSHAAIVAREYGIPGVVGSRDATKIIADGAQVRIDGNAGEVTVLG
jgi:pyruvate,water dikinase